jgi:hypothetical protein
MQKSILSFNIGDDVLFAPAKKAKHIYEFIGKIVDYGRESDSLVVEDLATGDKRECLIGELEKLELE